jgi:hypothetical protein
MSSTPSNRRRRRPLSFTTTCYGVDPGGCVFGRSPAIFVDSALQVGWPNPPLLTV